MKLNPPRFGGMEPKYTCCINPFTNVRFSRCPACENRTQIREFALVVHVEPEGIYPTRIPCKWCLPCSLIVVHKHELERSIQTGLADISPDQVGSNYFIIGVLEMRIWTRLNKGLAFLETVKKWTSDFLDIVELQSQNSGG